MKSKIIVIILIIIVIISSFFFIGNNFFFKVNETVNDNISKTNNGIAMMLEKTAGQGDYESTTLSKWPTDAYKFNSELSRCEKGGVLSWDDEQKAVVFHGDKTDKCYYYFDKLKTTFEYDKDYVLPLLTSCPFFYGCTYGRKDWIYTGNNGKLLSNFYSDKLIVNVISFDDYLINNNIDYDDLGNVFVVYDPIIIAPNYCDNNSCTTINLYEQDFIIDSNKNKIYYNSVDNSIYAYLYRKTDSIYFLFQVIDGEKSPSDWYLFYTYVYCLSENTEVYVYDKKRKKYKKKKIKDIDYDDEILCWNFDEGKFSKSKPIWIMKERLTNKVNVLKFSDGSVLETIDQHRIFNKELGKFTYPMSDDTPIGTTTFNAQGEYVTLISKEVVEKPVYYYNIMTYEHINLFANNILTSSRLNNIYEIKDMKFVYDKKRCNNYDLNEYDKEIIEGLRLREQPIKEANLKSYVNNMLDIKK